MTKPQTMTRLEKANQLGVKELRVHMGLFDYSVQFVVGDYAKSVKFASWILDDKYEVVEQMDAEINGGHTPRGKTFRRSGYLPVVWVPRRPRGGRELATLAHECLHAIFDLIEWANMPIDRSTEELMCHAQAHLVTEFLEGIK